MTLHEDTASKLRIPPPTYYIVMIIVGISINYFIPLDIFPTNAGDTIAIILFVVSVIIIAPTLVKFKSAGTPFDVRKSATELIINGPYKYSRNPAYVSLTILYVSIGLWLNNLWILMLVVIPLLILNYHVIKCEETELERIFGDSYLNYKSSVRRWL